MGSFRTGTGEATPFVARAKLGSPRDQARNTFLARWASSSASWCQQVREESRYTRLDSYIQRTEVSSVEEISSASAKNKQHLHLYCPMYQFEFPRFNALSRQCRPAPAVSDLTSCLPRSTKAWSSRRFGSRCRIGVEATPEPREVGFTSIRTSRASRRSSPAQSS